MNNKYYKRSHISETKFRYLIKCFSLDLTATETAELTGISLRSITVIFDKLRCKITGWCQQVPPIEGTVEVDESYFGPKRVPGKRGRGAAKKTIVFGIFKRGGNVYTAIDTRYRPSHQCRMPRLPTQVDRNGCLRQSLVKSSEFTESLITHKIIV